MVKCFNRNVLIGLAAVGVGLWAIAPSAAGAAVPALVMLACPLSMVFMMRSMSGKASDRCATGSVTPATEATGNPRDTRTELIRLQAEVDQLRSEPGDRPHRQPSP